MSQTNNIPITQFAGKDDVLFGLREDLSAATPIEMDTSLSVVMTTSPVVSNPDTFVIESALNSLLAFVPKQTPIYLCFDGYSVRDGNQFKQSQVTQEQAEKYEQFKEIVMEKFIEIYFRENHGLVQLSESSVSFQTSYKDITIKIIEYSFMQQKITFLYPSVRLGFALAVKRCLDLIHSNYVLVNQHDWEFEKPPKNLELILRTMEKYSEFMNYVSFPASSVRKYPAQMWNVRRVPNVHCSSDDSKFGQVTTSKCEHCEWIGKETVNGYQKDPTPAPFVFNGFPFYRLYFWYDKPHIARVKFYKEQVFGIGLMKRGDFIEDVYGHKLLADVRDNGIEAHLKYGTWLLWQDDIYLKHLHGRKYLTDEMREQIKNGPRKSRRERIREIKYGYPPSTTQDTEVLSDRSDMCSEEYDQLMNLF